MGEKLTVLPQYVPSDQIMCKELKRLPPVKVPGFKAADQIAGVSDEFTVHGSMRRCAGKTGGQNDFFLVLKMFGNIANQRVNECCNLIDRSLQQQGGKDVVDVPKQGSMLGVKFG